MSEEFICYCFSYTAADIVRDIQTYGRSMIFEQILAAKKVGGCQCVTKNPKGR